MGMKHLRFTVRKQWRIAWQQEVSQSSINEQRVCESKKSVVRVGYNKCILFGLLSLYVINLRCFFGGNNVANLRNELRSAFVIGNGDYSEVLQIADVWKNKQKRELQYEKVQTDQSVGYSIGCEFRQVSFEMNEIQEDYVNGGGVQRIQEFRTGVDNKYEMIFTSSNYHGYELAIKQHNIMEDQQIVINHYKVIRKGQVGMIINTVTGGNNAKSMLKMDADKKNLMQIMKRIEVKKEKVGSRTDGMEYHYGTRQPRFTSSQGQDGLGSFLFLFLFLEKFMKIVKVYRLEQWNSKKLVEKQVEAFVIFSLVFEALGMSLITSMKSEKESSLNIVSVLHSHLDGYGI